MKRKSSIDQPTDGRSLWSVLSPVIIQGLLLFLLRRFFRGAGKVVSPQATLVALLIDGENIPALLSRQIVLEAEKLGHVITKRVYGNWASPTMQGWKDAVLQHAMEVKHSLQTANGKNAADIALVVDAMDLLHTEGVTHFCLVSSDTDYTPLILRLRAANRRVLGIGKPTPTLMKACTWFVALDHLETGDTRSHSCQAQQNGTGHTPSTASSSESKALTSQAETPTTTSESSRHSQLAELLTKAYALATKEGENAGTTVALLGVALKQCDAQFTTKAYGYKNLTALVQASPDIFVTRSNNGKGEMEIHLR